MQGKPGILRGSVEVGPGMKKPFPEEHIGIGIIPLPGFRVVSEQAGISDGQKIPHSIRRGVYPGEFMIVPALVEKNLLTVRQFQGTPGIKNSP